MIQLTNWCLKLSKIKPQYLIQLYNHLPCGRYNHLVVLMKHPPVAPNEDHRRWFDLGLHLRLSLPLRNGMFAFRSLHFVRIQFERRSIFIAIKLNILQTISYSLIKICIRVIFSQYDHGIIDHYRWSERHKYHVLHGKHYMIQL